MASWMASGMDVFANLVLALNDGDTGRREADVDFSHATVVAKSHPMESHARAPTSRCNSASASRAVTA